MKPYLRDRIRTIVLANSILSILLQFVWLIYASGHGMPVSQRFLTWRQQSDRMIEGHRHSRVV